jgi:hypothetical protein
VNSGPAGKLSLHRSPFTFGNHTLDLLQIDARHQNCCDRKPGDLFHHSRASLGSARSHPIHLPDIAVIPLYIATLTNNPSLNPCFRPDSSASPGLHQSIANEPLAALHWDFVSTRPFTSLNQNRDGVHPNATRMRMYSAKAKCSKTINSEFLRRCKG